MIKEENTFTENLIDFQPKPIKNDFTDFLGDLYKLQTTNLFEKTKAVTTTTNSNTETTPSAVNALNFNSTVDLRYAPTVRVLPTGPINLRPEVNKQLTSCYTGSTGNNNGHQIQIGASTGAMPKSQSWTANLNRNQAELRSSLPKSATTR